MRIGFDAKRAFNNRRGLGNYSRETLRILTTLGPEHQDYLFTPRIDPGIGFECPAGVFLLRERVFAVANYFSITFAKLVMEI